MKKWYGCPKCTSQDYYRRVFDEGCGVRTLFYCRSCSHIFYSALLWEIDDKFDYFEQHPRTDE